MCVVCGCSSGHSHPPVPTARDDLHYGLGAAGVSLPGVSQSRTIRIEQDVLGENDRHAAGNRLGFERHGVLALNLVSSPGSARPPCSAPPSRPCSSASRTCRWR